MGAGKTTAIKLMRGLDSPTEGEITVRGTSSKKLGAKEFESIGYVSENHNLPLWMSVQRYLDFCRPLYPGWDAELEALLVSIPHSSESFPSEELMAHPFDSHQHQKSGSEAKKASLDELKKIPFLLSRQISNPSCP
ncbi:ATP-binding cassette domain-containing protein [Verrucomicrobiaceae bacterium 227]